MKLKVVRADFLTSATAPEGYPPVDVPEIAFAGRSNVGKSSLLNVLAARKGLAITSNTPGRTRLVNFFELDLNPGPGVLRLVDLPGYGFAKAPREEREAWRARVESYVTGRINLRGVVHLVDIRHDPSELDLDLTEWLKALGRDEIPVMTKADKLSRNEQLTRSRALEKAMGLPPESAVVFSALKGDGRELLWKRILAVL